MTQVGVNVFCNNLYFLPTLDKISCRMRSLLDCPRLLMIDSKVGLTRGVINWVMKSFMLILVDPKIRCFGIAKACLTALRCLSANTYKNCCITN